ncbi:MAG: cytochrome P450, partial [bacterium]
MVLTDDRFIRNRGKATGKGTSPLPFFVPKGIAAIARSMILEDDPEHRRLRHLVNKAFTPRAIASLSDRIESLSGDLLDGVAKKSTIDLLPEYALPIPSRVI